MWGRSKSPVEQVADAVSSTVGDVKVGAIKGAAGGALSTLGSKVADTVQSSNGNQDKNARKAQRNSGKALSDAADNAKKVDVQGAADNAGNILQSLGSKAGDAAGSAANNAGNLNINVDANDIPRLLRGLALLAAGFGTLFAPGSVLDASKGGSVDVGKISGQARKGIDSASGATQDSIKEIVDLTKDGLSSLSDALTGGIEEAEKRAEKALDQTEKNLTKATKQTAKNAKKSLPKEKKGGGTLRFLFYGLLIGGVVAFLSSPLSGPLGERVTNLRRDLGLGGDDDSDDDSKYWPSPPQDSAAPTQMTDSATATPPGTGNGATPSSASTNSGSSVSSGSASDTVSTDPGQP